MNRRRFLKMLSAGGFIAAGGEIWIPGEKVISLPAKHSYYDGMVITHTPGNETVSWTQKLDPEIEWILPSITRVFEKRIKAEYLRSAHTRLLVDNLALQSQKPKLRFS